MEIHTSGQSERWETLLLAADLVNADELDVETTRTMLTEYRFVRARSASGSSLRRLIESLGDLKELMDALLNVSLEQATARVNEELTEVRFTPLIAAHDGLGPHMHWTDGSARFDDQVIADIMISLAFELCENGVDRFGRCDATDCESIFFDTTRNRSRRFCADPRCASRTHTADHRARQKTAPEKEHP